MQRLTLFDLDHTLLDGDSDVLWCEFLMDQGVLDRAAFGERNAAMERDYRAGSVSVRYRAVRTSPTTSSRASPSRPIRKRRPVGSAPGHSRSAMASLITATYGDPGRSLDAKQE